MMSYYLANLEDAIQARFGCNATHRETVFVHERTAENQTIWFGDVEVFDLIDCEGTQVCYAWQSFEGGIRTVTILHSTTVDSPQRAVQAAISSGEQPSMLRADKNPTATTETLPERVEEQPKEPLPLYEAPIRAEDLEAIVQAMWRPGRARDGAAGSNVRR
jgi:hypothetical protein